MKYIIRFILIGLLPFYVNAQTPDFLVLKKKNKTIEVLFVKNDIRLPRTVGRKRNAYKKGEISDYVLLQHKDGVLIV